MMEDGVDIDIANNEGKLLSILQRRGTTNGSWHYCRKKALECRRNHLQAEVFLLLRLSVRNRRRERMHYPLIERLEVLLSSGSQCDGGGWSRVTASWAYGYRRIVTDWWGERGLGWRVFLLCFCSCLLDFYFMCMSPM